MLHHVKSCRNQPSIIQPKFGLWQFLSPGFGEYFAFISISKEDINKIQIDSRSRNNALSSDKNFLFRKLMNYLSDRNDFENRNEIAQVILWELEWNIPGIIMKSQWNRPGIIMKIAMKYPRHYYENRNDISRH